jgi:Flp pilus assembly protein TadG
VTGRAPGRRIVARVTKRQTDERGQVTAFVVVITMALILCAGLVIDGGLTLAAKVRATDEAQAAARAGAEAIDLTTYRSTGTIVLDPAQAADAAQHYLVSTGNQGQVDVTGDVVTVTVKETQPTQILGVVGLHATTVSASASATAVRGITGPDQ